MGVALPEEWTKKNKQHWGTEITFWTPGFNWKLVVIVRFELETFTNQDAQEHGWLPHRHFSPSAILPSGKLPIPGVIQPYSINLVWRPNKVNWESTEDRIHNIPVFSNYLKFSAVSNWKESIANEME